MLFAPRFQAQLVQRLCFKGTCAFPPQRVSWRGNNMSRPALRTKCAVTARRRCSLPVSACGQAPPSLSRRSHPYRWCQCSPRSTSPTSRCRCSAIRHENITYPKKIFSNYFPITVSRFRSLRINFRKLPDTYCICVSCVTLPGWDPCPCRIIFYYRYPI